MAKAKGKEKPAASTVPAEVEEATGNDVTAEPTPSEPVEMEEAAETTVDDGKSEEAEKTEEEEEKEEVKEDGTVEDAMDTVTPGDDKAEEVDKKEEVKGDEKVENASNKKAKRIRKRKKKAAGAGAAGSNDADKPETSAPEKKDLKKADGKGLIFMCNAKTKKDCYQYKVLGLPENKKEMVENIYKGMRLFLFDVDLKLMYGIYKAASPGGYNIEPKAFKSAFPSQVRFTVLNDCQPLPEEKFKAAIKANYYGKNKFNAQLSQEQVKNLCKLFMSENKAPKQKHVGGASKAPISLGRDRKRPRDTFQRNDRYYPRAPAYPREAYASPPVPRPIALPAPPPPPAYAYERPVDDYYYRREPRMMDVEMRREPIEYRDPYSLYREPAPYREAAYPVSGPYAPPPYRY